MQRKTRFSRKGDRGVGEIPQKREAEDKHRKNTRKIVYTKLLSLKDNLIEALRIKGGTFHL